MKTKRNLSGIYFRFKDENGNWGNRCFEDLPKSTQQEILTTKDKEWLVAMVIELSDTLNGIGDTFDLTRE